jgi:hypothetical protein
MAIFTYDRGWLKGKGERAITVRPIGTTIEKEHETTEKQPKLKRLETAAPAPSLRAVRR